MTDSSGSVTLSGGSSGTAITISNDYVQAHANIFQSMTVAVLAYGPGAYSYPPADNALVIASGQGDVEVTGPAASSALLVGNGTTLDYVGQGDAQIYAGNGNDTVSTGAGNDLVALGAGTNSISLGGGTNTVISGGFDDRIAGGSGSAQITLTGLGATVAGGTGALAIDDSAGSGSMIYLQSAGTVRGSDISVTAVVGSSDETVDGGLGGVSYTQTAGTLRFVGLGGSVSIDGGANAGADSLYGASGTAVILSSATRNNVFVGNDARAGNGGNVTLDGSLATGGNQFWAGSGNTSLVGGSGADTLVAGTGNVTMTGGIGAANTFDIFKFQAGSGVNVTITDFGAASGNVITLFGYGASGVSAALQSAKQVNADTVLQLNDGTSITLANYDATKLNQSSFLFTNSSS